MKIYLDLAKQAITKKTDEKVYEGDFYSNVFEVLFYNYEDENWFPTMSQLAPNGREAGDFTADALGVGESHTYVEDGQTYLRFTFTMGATWVLMKGKSNFYIWVNRLNGTVLKKCVGKVNVMIDQSTDNYFIADVTFNPNVKAYIDAYLDEQNEVIAQLGTGEPKYFDTAANIALLEEDKGLAVATDTGYVFYWDVTEEDATKYKNSGLQYTNLSAYYTKTQADTLLANKADKSTTYTKTDIDNSLANYLQKKNYLKAGELLPQGTTAVTLNVSYVYSRTLVFKFTANASNTYMNMVVNNVNVTGTQLINSGNSYIFKMKLQQDISSVSVWSGQSSLLMDVYYDIEEEILNTSELAFRNDVRLNGITSTIKNGYLDSSGVERSSGDYKIATLVGVNEGDIIQYTGCYGNWATLWGYQADGTATALNTAGNNILEYFVVPANIVSIKVFSQNSIEQVYLVDLGKTTIPINQNVSIISYCNRTNYQSTINSIGKRSANVTFNANYSNICFKTKTINITSSSDYVLTRFKIKSDTDCMIETVSFLVNNEQQGSRYFLQANKEYEFYNFSKGFANTGTFNFQIQIPVVSSAITLDISDLIIVKNSMDAWYDAESKETLKTFSPNNLIVDANGNGNFYDISHACEFAKKCYDVLNENVTIFVNKGYYLEHPTNNYPYACINKGANKISIIGVNSNDVIIDCYNTSSVQSKVLDIGGECTIKGLTIRCLNDGTYNTSNDLGHNAYCIHNDSAYSTNDKYTTLVEDCILYSECHSPLGAGLRNKQTQKYKNVNFISNGIISNGACYIHASAESTASDMEVIIDNCICDSKDGTKAITLPNVNGSLPYTSIPTTICKTIGVTSGANVTDSNFKTNHLLTNISLLNNENDWNYEV